MFKSHCSSLLFLISLLCVLCFSACSAPGPTPKDEYTLEDFSSIVIGLSTAEDVHRIAPQDTLNVSEYGAWENFPGENGRAIAIDYTGSDLVVSKILLLAAPKDEYNLEDFVSVVIGQSTAEDVHRIAPQDALNVFEGGAWEDYPGENGQTIAFDYEGPDLVVSKMRLLAAPKDEYTMEDFASIVIGQSTVDDVYCIAPCGSFMITAEGGRKDLPAANGQTLTVTFYGPDFIVGSIDIH